MCRPEKTAPEATVALFAVAVTAVAAAGYVAYITLEAIIGAVLVATGVIVVLAVAGAVVRLRWEHTHGLPLWQSRKAMRAQLELVTAERLAIARPQPVTVTILADRHEKVAR